MGQRRAENKASVGDTRARMGYSAELGQAERSGTRRCLVSTPRGTVGRRAPCWQGTVDWAIVTPGCRRKQDIEISSSVRDNSLEPLKTDCLTGYLATDSYIINVKRKQRAQYPDSHPGDRSITHRN